VRLKAGGSTMTRPLAVRMDPRVKTPLAALRIQLDLSRRLAQALQTDTELARRIRDLRSGRPTDPALESLEGTTEERRPWAKEQPPALVPWNARIAAIYDVLQSSDLAPTPQATAAAENVLQEAAELFRRARQALEPQK
jgi:hypothetical protein